MYTHEFPKQNPYKILHLDTCDSSENQNKYNGNNKFE